MRAPAYLTLLKTARASSGRFLTLVVEAVAHEEGAHVVSAVGDFDDDTDDAPTEESEHEGEHLARHRDPQHAKRCKDFGLVMCEHLWQWFYGTRGTEMLKKSTIETP